MNLSNSFLPKQFQYLRGKNLENILFSQKKATENVFIKKKKILFSELQSKSSVEKLLKNLSQRYEKRNGGYSRVIRAGFRYGDDAPMAVIELVDRDPNAKKVDIKKKPQESEKSSLTSKPKDSDKKTKSKK